MSILLLWGYQAYVLGWTRKLIGTVGSGAWSGRDRYAAMGFASMDHLSVVNIARSVMLVPLVLLLVYAFAFPAAIHRRGLAVRCVFVATLAALGVYSIIVGDVPFNFYGSRYFLPLVVPLAMASFGLIISAWKPWPAAIAVALVFAASSYHVLGLVKEPAYQNGIGLQLEIARRAQRHDVAFLVGARPAQKLLQGGMEGLLDIPVVFIDTARAADPAEVQATMNEYMASLRAERALVVSERRQSFMAMQERLGARTSTIPFAIRFDTHARGLAEYHYYAGSYRDASTLLSNSNPQWIVGGRLSLLMEEAIPGRRLRVRTGGGWLWAMEHGGGRTDIEVSVDGRAAPLLAREGSDFLFGMPAGHAGAAQLEIRTSTFVPAEIGINADRRSLGADLLFVRFDPAPREPESAE